MSIPMEPTGNEKWTGVIDLGCGPNKLDGALGVDHYPYAGVDLVANLDQFPWPIKSNSQSCIYARHIIEHVAEIRLFLNEIHRIGCDGATVKIVTPHFSSLDSWKDPTHRWHFAGSWYKSFTEQYMAGQVLPFEHRETEITFGKSIRAIVPRIMVRLAGYNWWEKHYAFIFRARNIFTTLAIRK